MENKHDLKACPFCGGDARLRTAYKKGGNGGCELYGWSVECEKCGMKTRIFEDAAIRDESGIRLTRDGIQDAIDVWNNRTNA